MATATKIKGRAALLTLKVGAATAAPYQDDATSIVLDNEEADADVTTFADAAAGGSRQWFLAISAVQSTAAASLHDYLWTNSGAVANYVYAPHGNTTPSASQPHYTGTCTLPAKPKIGGDAGAKVTYTFEVRIDCEQEPTKVAA